MNLIIPFEKLIKHNIYLPCSNKCHTSTLNINDKNFIRLAYSDAFVNINTLIIDTGITFTNKENYFNHYKLEINHKEYRKRINKLIELEKYILDNILTTNTHYEKKYELNNIFNSNILKVYKDNIKKNRDTILFKIHGISVENNVISLVYKFFI